MKHLKLFFALFAMLALGVGNAWGATYTKVTSAPADWSGEYIVVYESDNTAYVWTGVDAAKCNTTATISSNSVTGDFVTVTIASMSGGYSIKVNGGSNAGKYIYGTSGSNKLNFGTTAQLNTLSYEVDWVKITSNTSVLTFNKTSSDMRFRYYKSSSYSSQQHIQLYKLSTGGSVTPDPIAVTLDKSTLSLEEGENATLTATVTGSTDAVTWTSDASNIASVDNAGKVTAIAAGEATITAAIGDVKATCAVTVTAATTPEEPGTGGESGGTPTEVTISFANTNQRVSQDSNSQVWANEGVTFTNSKSASTNAVVGNTNPIRCYANSSMDIEAPGNINKIVFDCNTNDYATAMKNSIGAAATASADKVTVELDGTSATFNVAKLTAQVRLDNLSVTYTASGSDEPEAEIVKTLKSIAVSDMTTIYEQGDAFSFDGKCTATYSVTKDGVEQAPQTATVTPTSVSKPDMTQLGTPTVTVTYTEGDVTKTAEYKITIEEAPTYNFTKIDMSEWGTSYNERVVTYEDATVTFASASKQSGTITDQPVTKGGDVSLVLTDGMNIATVKWVCTQWTTKAQIITLHYSKDGGNVYTSTEITSSDFTISSDNLPAGTNAVKITFNSTSNQVGIKSCTITKVEAAAITQVPAPQFSLQGGAYDGAQSVELTCTMADATIHYTTDGTTPTTSSSVYSTAIQVTESMTIKAYAVKEGLEDSPVVEATYEISAPADVVLDFTTNNWELPSGSANKVTTEASYTDGTYTVSVAGTNGHYFDTNNLITGKKDAYIVLPIFNKPIVKIVCEGVDAGSGSVTFNVYVDDEAVSTAVTSCKVDQTFLIAEDMQVANVAHVIKVTNEYNLRIAKIKIYLGEAPAVERPIIGGDEEFAGSTEVSITCATSGAKIYYTTDGNEPTNASDEYTTPFELSATTTVKAIAYADGQASAVATKTFTLIETPELPTTAENATFVFNTAEGLANLGIAYPTTVDGTGKKTDIENSTTVISNGVGLTMTGGNTTATRIWLTANGALDLRVYKGATLTFAVADGYEIKKVVFDGSTLTNLAVNNEPLNGTTWEGSQKTITFENVDGTVKINTIAVTVAYTRDVTIGRYGTICLPYASASTSGAYFYEVVGRGTENGKPAVYLASVDALEAGVPYIFEATASTIKVTYEGEAVDAPQNGDANGLVGTFVETTVPDGDYILYNNAFCTNEDGPVNKIRAYRAYLDMDAVEGGAPQQMPGRRYIGMSVQGENEATGFENITAPAGKTIKAIVNGQLIIIRDGEMYNAQGQRL